MILICVTQRGCRLFFRLFSLKWIERERGINEREENRTCRTDAVKIFGDAALNWPF